MADLVDLIITPRPHDLGGFNVRRVLPFHKRRNVGPFVFFDHLGPAEFAPGRGIDVRSHPHIGLATVTWLFDGALDHRDSLGTHKTIRPGAVNWMTAGRGIVHTERSPPAERARGHRIHAVQTWVALPRAFEECAPSFAHHPASELPKIDISGLKVTLIAGEAFDRTSPVAFPAPILLMAIEAQSASRVELPKAQELAVYAVRGDLGIAGEPVGEAQMAVLKDGARGELHLAEGSIAMICGGAALDAPRVMDWNFVSSSKSRIERAQADWRASIDAGFVDSYFSQPAGEVSWIPLPGDPQPEPEDTPPA
ncbi:pirin family protein [bacterium]|nr:pirin family protein [bacterium]